MNTPFPTIAIPAGQQAYIAGLQFNTMSVSGNVTFDQCTFTGGFARFTATQAILHLQDCNVIPGPAPLMVSPVPTTFDQCEVYASQCQFSGVDGFVASTAAISMTNSKLYGNVLTITAGSGGPSAPALVADAASTVVLTDSSITSPTVPCPLQASQGHLTRCVLTPACAPLPTQPGISVVRPNAQAPTIGQVFGGTFRAAPGDLVFVWAALDLSPQPTAFTTSPLLLSLATAVPLAVVVVNPLGAASVGGTIPFDPMLQNRTIWLQAVLGTSFPLPASVAIGGLIR